MKGLERIENAFWKEVIRNYVEIKTVLKHEDINSANFQNLPIFNNSLVTYKNKTLFFHTWIDKGVEQIKQVMHPNENRMLILDGLQDLLNTN